MPSRRRVIIGSSAGMWLTAGCLGNISSPDIPRETQILDERATIEPGAYQAWSLTERIDSTSFTSTDETPIFSYEFVVNEGPAVSLAATTTEDLDRRREGGEFRIWGGTRTEGKRGGTSERIPTRYLEVLVADNQDADSQTPTPDRDPATIHVQAYSVAPNRTDYTEPHVQRSIR